MRPKEAIKRSETMNTPNTTRGNATTKVDSPRWGAWGVEGISYRSIHTSAACTTDTLAYFNRAAVALSNKASACAMH